MSPSRIGTSARAITWRRPASASGGSSFNTSLGRKLVQHVTDEEQADGLIGLQEAGGDLAHGELRKSPARGARGKVGRQGRVIPDAQRVELIGAEKGNRPAVGDAAAAAPVEHRAGFGRPAAQAQLAQHVVPFPADALAVGEIVAREGRLRFPVGRAERAALEKALAQAIERRPVEIGPDHEGVTRSREEREDGEKIISDSSRPSRLRVTQDRRIPRAGPVETPAGGRGLGCGCRRSRRGRGRGGPGRRRPCRAGGS